jgi:hypothetical protein
VYPPIHRKVDAEINVILLHGHKQELECVAVEGIGRLLNQLVAVAVFRSHICQLRVRYTFPDQMNGSTTIHLHTVGGVKLR